jgi:hypothetical protein
MSQLFLINFLVALVLVLNVSATNLQTSAVAPRVTNNPNVTYAAKLLTKNNTNLGGIISGTTGANGQGVMFDVHFWGFPDESLGPFSRFHSYCDSSNPFLTQYHPEYHIHVNKVPKDGNCTAALGHLDPYNRTTTPACDPEAPETCQVGDLSGKHGEIVAGPDTPFQDTYMDYYLSTKAGDVAFFGNLSVVVHAANDTRLDCGNFELVSASTLTSSGSASLVKATPTTITSTSAFPAFTGSATLASGISSSALLLALVAFLL